MEAISLGGHFMKFMHDLNSMMETPLDQKHTDVFLSLIHKLNVQLIDNEPTLPEWRVYTDYC